MARYADPFTCPDCRTRLPIDVTRCPSCRLDLRSPLASELLQALMTADDLLVRLRTESAAQPVGVPVERTPYPAPAPAPRRPRGLSGASVPRILLSLGALCLLVAAVIFLAVAWTWLGVGGRTAVLVGLTVVSGGLGVVLGRRALRIAAEALTTVALGLLTLDVVGADSAGWLGDPSNAALVTLTSAVVLVAALALSLTTRLGAPQLVSAAAISGVGLGALAATEQWQLVSGLLVVGYAVAAAAAPTYLSILRVAAIAGGSLWWVGLAFGGLEEATSHPTWSGLWVDGHGYALLAASLLLLLPLVVDRTQALLVRAIVTVSAAMLTATVALPAVDEDATTLALAGLALLAVWTVVARVVPTAWRVAAWVPMALGAAPVVGVVSVLATQAAANALDPAAPYSSTIGLQLSEADAIAAPALLAVGVAALVAALLAITPRSLPGLLAGGTVVALGLVGTLALHAVPLWTVVAALTAIGAALLADGVRRGDRLGALEAVAGGLVLLTAVVLALSSAGLTSVVAAVVVLGAAAARWRGAFPGAGDAAGAALAVAVGAFVWSVLTASGVETEWRGLPVLVVVGLLAIALPTPEVEIGAGLTAFVAATGAVAAAGDTATSLALHLTLAGTMVTASALVHADRRILAAPGGLLLAAATWVRLADLGVDAPEAYTLPSAVVLLVLGTLWLRRDPSTPTARALGAGLALATVPSLLWVLVDPVSTRAVLLGACCLVLVLAGAQLRWSAPLVVGATVGTLLVLRELAPYAGAVPQWALIGTAGTLLTVVGITWESRMRDLRFAAGYLRRLQ